MNNVHNKPPVPGMYRALWTRREKRYKDVVRPKGNSRMLGRSRPGELGEYPVTVVPSLREWAGIAPEHPLISERARGDWRTVSYGRAVAPADAIGQALLDAGQALLDALPGIPAVVSAGHRDEAEQLSVLMNTNPGEAVRTAFANLSPDGTAKILFTSGSTRDDQLGRHAVVDAGRPVPALEADPEFAARFFSRPRRGRARRPSRPLCRAGLPRQDRRGLRAPGRLGGHAVRRPVPAGVVVAERTS